MVDWIGGDGREDVAAKRKLGALGGGRRLPILVDGSGGGREIVSTGSSGEGRGNCGREESVAEGRDRGQED